MRFSVLNCLTDPKAAQVENVERSEQHIERLKAYIQRDLNALLNTRRAERDFDASYVESTNSLLTFGVADFTAYNLTSQVDQERVRQSIERAIRQFEPRLSQVEVRLEPADLTTPVLRFHIEGLLRITPDPEAVVFSARFQRDSRHIVVSGAASAR